MEDKKKTKLQNIPFVVDGARIVKSISKNTTCSDVIAKLPNLQIPLAVFLSVDGVLKELPGKAKLMKVWRANGSAKCVEFVIRKSENMTKKVKRDTKKVIGDKKEKEKPVRRNSRLSKETLKQVSDLAFYVRYQKLKVKNFAKKTEKQPADDKGTPQTKLMKKMTSHASTNSMDAFLEKADLDAMARFLSFCGQVTTERLSGKPAPEQQTLPAKNDSLHQMSSISRSSSTEKLSSSKSFFNKDAIYSSLQSMKLGIKQKFNTSQSVEPKRTSTTTIGSADTGYHSVDTESQSGNHQEIQSQPDVSMSKKSAKRHHTKLLEDIDGIQRHSTPIFGSRQQKRTANTLDCTITQEKLNDLDDCPIEGKSLILEKFMAEQTMPVTVDQTADDLLFSPQAKRQRLERQSLPAFRSQEDVCRFLWNRYCDSDSDTDSEADDNVRKSLDVAFTACDEFVPRKLRRESGISNLNRFAMGSRFSLPAQTTKSTGSEEFNYSFDCSFPRMDESKSVDFTVDYSFSDSESSKVVLDLWPTQKSLGKKRSPDAEVDSFMNSRSFSEDSLDFTTCADNILDRNISISDELLNISCKAC